MVAKVALVVELCVELITLDFSIPLPEILFLHTGFRLIIYFANNVFVCTGLHKLSHVIRKIHLSLTFVASVVIVHYFSTQSFYERQFITKADFRFKTSPVPVII